MFKQVNDWLVQQIPPLALLALALLGWTGFLLFTPKKLDLLQAQQAQLTQQAAARDTAVDRRLDRLELVSTNLVKRACWESDNRWRLWLGCAEILGNNLPRSR